MKNSKEMADAVFRIRDACIEKRNKRRIIIKRAALVCSTACMFALVFAGIKIASPERPHGTGITVIEATEGTSVTVRATEAKVTTLRTAATAAAESAVTAAAQTAEAPVTSVTEAATAPVTETATAETTAAPAETAATQTVTDEAEYFVPDVTTTSADDTQVEACTASSTDTENTKGGAFPETAPIYQRYRSVEVNKGIYKATSWEAASMEIGELICTADLVSDDSLMRCNAAIYECVSPAETLYKPVIIKFDGYDGYWIYSRN